jgi:pentatricopeptide repeat protein
MMIDEAAEYIRARVNREEKLQEMKALADQYFKSGQYEKARKILEKILEEAQGIMVE